MIIFIGQDLQMKITDTVYEIREYQVCNPVEHHTVCGYMMCDLHSKWLIIYC